ncbi:glycan biosynthesis hexose transferase WsfD [Clostridium weizhouense]|uniref:Transmembrane protein n=1 Tax=Clostridium weizhouense TaxID=2859781 RepID=A0ABS7AS37_9CLOT|nr:hypothetical protein [Clostridium weizhouense]MBW6411483.1 hypothetical protein [Clostridium weizhouense]
MKAERKFKNNYESYLLLSFIIISICIISFVLFKSPQLGVADQGDFDRVMNSSGLSLLDSYSSNSKFNRFYNYIITDYIITDNFDYPITIVSSSLTWLIALISFICKLLNQNIFKTQYLAVAYSILYIFSITMILKYLNIKNKFKLTLISLLTLFILFDGNYILWFNSLYGEPMMLTTLLIFIATCSYYIDYKYVKKNTDKLTSKLVLIILAGFLLLGSKMQLLTALPFLIVLISKILIDNCNLLSKRNFILLIVLFLIMIIYPLKINAVNTNISKDTQYNSVFFGILNESKTPKQDLIDLGLNPDMAVEAGKHSYLDESEYVKYVPKTEITEQEFYSKMKNSKLAKFYLTHPIRLINGLKYTASKAFYTGTPLGKTSIKYSKEPIIEFNRFTNWSYFRENFIPKKLSFIIATFIIVFLFSLYKYFKNKNNLELRNKIFLLWIIMLIGTVQFPMPFVGNGKADTAKQLFLFNFIFDILLIIIACYIFSKILTLYKLCYSRKFKFSMKKIILFISNIQNLMLL